MIAKPTFVVSAAAASIVAGAAAAFSGPDVFVCLLGGNAPNAGFINYGTANGKRAYAVLTIACNQGDQIARWIDEDPPGPSNAHPVIATNMYRLRNGQFEQIGMSWLKHGYAAAQVDWCTTCQPGGDQNHLGIGCCDVYDSTVNGNQFGMGPRSDVNAATGFFPFPYCSPANGSMACPPISNLTDRRLQVKQTDLDTSAGVLYFIEVHYVLPDDAVLADPRTDFNNASHRRVSLNSSGDLFAWGSPTVQYEPAIRAWRNNGAGAGVPDFSIQEASVDVPDDGRFWVAAKVTQLDENLWRYEYAVHNLNSDRSGGTFKVPLPIGNGLEVTNIGFHDVDYHSGEPYSLADWTPTISIDNLTWATETYDTNVNANALRWGTLYNFRFDANVHPVMGDTTIGLFKPGEPGSVTVTGIPVPSPVAPCAPDISPVEGDGVVNVSDLLAIISNWGECFVPCPYDFVPPGGDTLVGIEELLAAVNAWGACP